MKYLIEKAWFIASRVNIAGIDGLGGNRRYKHFH